MPLTAHGEALEAKYDGGFASLKKAIVSHVPAVDEKKAAFTPNVDPNNG